MPIRGPLARFLLGAGVPCAAVLALIGGVALRTSGVVAVALAGAVAACLAGGVAREACSAHRTPPLEAAVQAAGWTFGALLVFAGIAVISGGTTAFLLGAGGSVVALCVWLLRSQRSGRPDSPHPTAAEFPGSGVAPSRPAPAAAWSAAPPAAAARVTEPVTELPTAALGREWLRTTAALAARLEPAARESIVRRRQEALDELERRDPEGFARWLAAGPAPGSDPADFVHGEPAGGRDA